MLASIPAAITSSLPSTEPAAARMSATARALLSGEPSPSSQKLKPRTRSTARICSRKASMTGPGCRFGSMLDRPPDSDKERLERPAG